MSTRRTLVEFVGIPGAGKSTLASRVVTTLESRGIPRLDGNALEAIVRSRFVGPTVVGTFARLVPDLLQHSQWASLVVRASLVGERRHVVARRLIRVTHRMRALLHTPSCVLVPEEWALHELVLALLAIGSAWKTHGPILLDAALARLAVPLIVVHCRLPVGTAAERVMRRRGSSEYDGRHTGEITPSFVTLAHICEWLTDALSRRGIPVTAVTTEGPPEVAAAAVLQVIAACSRLPDEHGRALGAASGASS